MKQNLKISTSKKLGIGAGIAAIGAGAYYLLGPKGKEHQKKVSALLGKMNKEIKSEIKKVKEVSLPLYHKAVDKISETYAKQYKIHGKDIKTFAKKLKSEWRETQ
jgi:gas vesicle protein